MLFEIILYFFEHKCVSFPSWDYENNFYSLFVIEVTPTNITVFWCLYHQNQ